MGTTPEAQEGATQWPLPVYAGAMDGGWQIIALMVPGFFVGWFILDRMRRPFFDEPGFMRNLFSHQPASVIAACTILGSGVLWVLLHAVGIM